MKKNLVSMLVVALCGFSFNAYADVIIDECELAEEGDTCTSDAGEGTCEMVEGALECVVSGTNNATNNTTNNATNNTTNNTTNNATNNTTNNATNGTNNETTAPAPTAEEEDEGGCSVAGSPSNMGLMVFGLMLLGMVRVARRRG